MIEIDCTPEATEKALEVHFAAGLPGFPSAHRFTLTQWGSAESPFMLLSALDEDDVGFVVISPWVFYPEYEFELDGATAERLGIDDPADAVVVCVVTLGDRPEDATVNLLGPIVVNRFSREACQAVLATSAYHVRAPLTRAA